MTLAIQKSGNFRRRKARLQAQERRRLAAKLRKKQNRRTTYENHRTSKAIVAYAHTAPDGPLKRAFGACRAIAIENLSGVENAAPLGRLGDPPSGKEVA